jgi:hypothetical protein
LATSLLWSAEGDYEQAETVAVAALRDNLKGGELTEEVFTALIQALFVVQRFDLVSAMLCDRHDFPANLEIALENTGRHPACLRWESASVGNHRFHFDTNILYDDNTAHKALHLHWIFPLFSNFAKSSAHENGSIIVNQFDVGVLPGLAFCDSRPDFFLLPDQIFVSTGAYAFPKKWFKEKNVPWQDRIPVAFWRGATTGQKAAPDDWRSLDRVKLCNLATRQQKCEAFDVGLTKVAQFRKQQKIEQEIEQSGLMRPFVPWQNWGNYKFLIEIDGNASSFSNMMQRLLSGSPVLKIESRRGLRQWYYPRLKPWQNYIPIAPDMSDLADIVSWLLRHDDVARGIGNAGRALAEGMTLQEELARSIPVISGGLRTFSGRRGEVEPANEFAYR